MIINSVQKHSIAQEVGLEIGDKLESINGYPIKDIIEYRFHISDEFVEVKINRAGEQLIYEIEKDFDDELGLTFQPIKYRCCGNKCIFCFIDQNPPQLRSDLYFKDEDFRLSFLHGNYVTLTNTTKSDLKRIVTQRLSPLYISIHATDQQVRSYMLGLKKDDHLLDKIQFLVDHDIELHAQIVLCPSINDGPILIQTLMDLASYHPCLKSVAIVPVGLTAHRSRLFQIKSMTPDQALHTIKTVEPIARDYQQKSGSYFVYLADEFYILAGQEIPAAARYEDYAQYENGVGMMRYFMDSFDEQSRQFPGRIKKPKRVGLVTAALAQNFLNETVIPRLNAIENLEAELIVAPNNFYGTSVTVTGLLTGADIYKALQNRTSDDLIVLPANCLNTDGLFLDDWTLEQLSQKLNQPVITLTDIEFEKLFSILD